MGGIAPILNGVRGATTAAGTTYAPSVPANWGPVPANLQAALDQIAATRAQGASLLGQGLYKLVYSLDFILDVFDVQGAVDLNAAGNSITIDNVVWRTPSTLNPNPDTGNMVAALTSFGVTANGLEIVNASNSRMDPGNVTAASIYASLQNIGLNDRTPFDGDPLANWIFEVELVSQVFGPSFPEHSGVAFWRDSSVTQPDLLGGPFLSRAGVGKNDASAQPRKGRFASQTSIAPVNYVTTIAQGAFDSAALHADAAAGHRGGVGVMAAGVFPRWDTLRVLASHSGSTATGGSADMTGDELGSKLGLYHCAETLAQNYDAVIRRFNIWKA